jgi:hypothetical protein
MMIEELQDIVSNKNKIKKYLPFIFGGVVLGGIGYIYSKRNTVPETTSNNILDDTSKIANASSGVGTSQQNNQNEIVSFFRDALNQTYKQTQVDYENLANEFRNNDATLSKQFTDITNEIKESVKLNTQVIVEQPKPSIAQTKIPENIPTNIPTSAQVQISTPVQNTIAPDAGSIKDDTGKIVGGQGGGVDWGQDVWNSLWNTNPSQTSVPVQTYTPPVQTTVPVQTYTPPVQTTVPVQTYTPPVQTTVPPDAGAIKDEKGKIVGGQGGNVTWGQDVWSELWKY